MNEVGGFKLPHFTGYNKELLFKRVGYWHNNRQRDQWNQIASLKIDHTYTINWCLTKVLKQFFEGMDDTLKCKS